MLALVTGGTGFVGSHLVEELLARGWSVRCTVRSASKLRWLEGKRVATVRADLLEPASLATAAEGVDAVFHVAGVLRGENYAEYRRGNVEATQNLLAAAGAAKRFVYVSSITACGPSPDGEPLSEDRPCAPISLYGRSKREAEEAVWARRDDLGVTIVRPPVVYGPRDEGMLDLYKTLARGLSPKIGGPKYTSLVHVRDLARGLALAAGEAGAGRIFFLSNREAVSFQELADLILRALGKRAVGVPIPDRVVRFLGGLAEDVTRVTGGGGLFSRDKALEMTQKYWTCSPESAKRRLGWESKIEPAEGFRATLAWYRAEKLL
jgi:nucleoside-diphosphate-sugar epimerase